MERGNVGAGAGGTYRFVTWSRAAR
jgi:hypothetical protein